MSGKSRTKHKSSGDGDGRGAGEAVRAGRCKNVAAMTTTTTTTVVVARECDRARNSVRKLLRARRRRPRTISVVVTRVPPPHTTAESSLRFRGFLRFFFYFSPKSFIGFSEIAYLPVRFGPCRVARRRFRCSDECDTRPRHGFLIRISAIRRKTSNQIKERKVNLGGGKKKTKANRYRLIVGSTKNGKCFSFFPILIFFFSPKTSVFETLSRHEETSLLEL